MTADEMLKELSVYDLVGAKKKIEIEMDIRAQIGKLLMECNIDMIGVGCNAREKILEKYREYNPVIRKANELFNADYDEF